MAISDYLNDVLKGRDIESDRLATDRARNLDAFRQFQSLFPDASAEDFARFADTASGTSVFQRNAFPTQQTFEKLSFFNQQKRAGDLSQLKLNEVKRQEEEHQVLMNVLDRAAMFATDETDWVTKARAMGGDQLSISIDKFLADKPTDTMFRASIMKQAEPYVKTAIAAKMSPAAIRSILPNSPALQKAVLAQVGSYYSAYAAQLGAAQAKMAEGAFGDMVKMLTAATGDTTFLSRMSSDERNRIVDSYIKTNPQAARFKDMFTKRLEALGELQTGVLAEKQTENLLSTQATAAAQRSEDTLAALSKKGPADIQKDYGLGETEAKQMIGKLTQLLEATKGKEKGASDWIVPPGALKRLVEEYKKDPVGFGQALDADVGAVLRSVGAMSKAEYQVDVQRQLQELRGTYRPMTSQETVQYFQQEAQSLRERADRIRAAILGSQFDASMQPGNADYRRMLTEYNDIVRRYRVLQERARDLDRDAPLYVKDREVFRANRKQLFGDVSDALSGLGTSMEEVGSLISRSAPGAPSTRAPASPANRTDFFTKPPAPPDAPEVRSTLTLKEAPTSEPGRVEIVLPNERIPPLSLDSAQKLGDYFADASKTGLNWKNGQPYQFIERSVVANTKLMLDAYSGKLDPATTAKVEQAAKDFGYTSVEQLYRAYRAKNPGVGLGFADPHGSITRAQASFLNNPDFKPSFDKLPPETQAKVRAIAESILSQSRAERSEDSEALRNLLIKRAAYSADPARSITVWSNYNSATGKGTKNYALSEKLIREAIKAAEEGRGTAR